MVEQFAVNELVVGSSPTSGAKNYSREKHCVELGFFCFTLRKSWFELAVD